MTRSPLRRRTRLKRQSARQKAFVRAYTGVRRDVLARDKGMCRACLLPGSEVHHVVKRSRDKSKRLDLANLILLCRSCHQWTDESFVGRRGKLVITQNSNGGFSIAAIRTPSIFALTPTT